MKHDKNKYAQTSSDFLKLIQNITKQGFFGNLETIMNSDESSGNRILSSIFIKGIAYIPSDKKYIKEGITPLIEPAQILEKIENDHIQKRNVTSVFFESKTENWPIWNRKGEEVIGSRGIKITFNLSVNFCKKKQS